MIQFKRSSLLVAVIFCVVCCDIDENTTDSADGAHGEDSDGAGSDDSDTGIPDDGSGGDSDTGPVTQYEGFEERYIVTEADWSDICRVRYEVRAVGEPSVPCEECEWDVVVEMRNPEVVIDVGGACANSDLGLDAEAMSAGDGGRVAYGYIVEYMGHPDSLMYLDESRGVWEAVTVASWNETQRTLTYDRRDGYCSFRTDDNDSAQTGICGMYGEATVSEEADAGVP
jgi:hypothetical protein